jgi:hypothetical protein
MAQRKYLLIKGAGGLGNRVLSLLSGIEYARLAGRIPVVEWCDGQYAARGENAFFTIFQETDRIRSMRDLPVSGDVTPEVWRADLMASPFDKISPVEQVRTSLLLTGLSLLLKRIKGSAFSFQFPWSYRKVCIDLSRTDQPETIGVFFAFTEKFYRLRRLYQRAGGALGCRSDAQKMKLVFERELILREDFADELCAAKKRLPDGKTIGVHLRYTDRKGSLRRAFSDIEKSVARHPGWNLFLVTDNRCVEQAVRERYPGLMTVRKWFPEEGGAIHGSGHCPDKAAMTRDAMKEILLLASCDYILYMGHSTFSVLARNLSGLPEGQTLDLNRFHLLNRLVLFLHKVC